MSPAARTALPLLGVAAGAWVLMLWLSRAMPAMSSGLLPAGVAMPPDLPAALFMGMWLAMMAAMMLPAIAAVAPTGRGDGLLSTGAFAAGYLAVWTAAGVVPLAVLAVLRSVPGDALMGRGASLAAGAVIVGAGLYQFTGWKSALLCACRSRPDGGVRAGVWYGVRCVGCSWALIAVLLVVGVMNLAWMAALTAVIVAERFVRRRTVVTLAAGGALVAGGVLVAVIPSVT